MESVYTALIGTFAICISTHKLMLGVQYFYKGECHEQELQFDNRPSGSTSDCNRDNRFCYCE